MILCKSVELEKAAKYGCCRNQPLELGDRDDEFGESGVSMFIFKNTRQKKTID